MSEILSIDEQKFLFKKDLAYRKILLKIGVVEVDSYIDKIIQLDRDFIDSLEYDKAGFFIDESRIIRHVKEEWDDFIKKEIWEIRETQEILKKRKGE